MPAVIPALGVSSFMLIHGRFKITAKEPVSLNHFRFPSVALTFSYDVIETLTRTYLYIEFHR